MRRAAVDERRAEILDATCAVVRERGFAGTRIADVATMLGISTGLVHYHFESKEQLLAEAFVFAAELDLERLRADVAGVHDPLGQIDTVIRRSLAIDTFGAWAMWIDAWGESMRNEAMRRIATDFDASYVELVRSAVEAGVEAGRFRCTDPEAMAWRIGALIDGMAVQMVVRHAVSSDDATTSVLRALRDELGVAGEPPTAPPATAPPASAPPAGD